MTERQNLKLELTWVGKDSRRPQLEPRILLPDPALSYAARKTEHDLYDNQLIFGDNLLALQSLATDPNVRGKVKCIFIDPPYNTGSAFEHYDDGMEHSLWLGMMRERLELLRELLSEEGSIWISLDDNEVHYLKVLADEIFGRSKFISNIVWQSKDTPGNNSAGIAQTHNHVLVYCKSNSFKINLLDRTEDQLSNYKNLDNDERGPWLGTPLTRAEFRERDYYTLKNDAGREVLPPQGSSWRRPRQKIQELSAEKRIYWGRNGDADFPVEKKFLSEVKSGVVNQTWWPYEIGGSTRNASAEMKAIFGTKAFDTPKPEKLIQRIIEIATNPGDLVLDSFAGSGTTGAVAHKMLRHWIMIELGEHAHTHIIPRLRKVIDGTDQGGISKAVSWQGGGGFKYSRLASSVLKKDKWDQYVINPQYNAEMLAEACCKVHGFVYAPSQNQQFYWMHGRSTESDFIYVTTNYLSHGQALEISEEVGPERTLLILTTAYDTQAENLPNLTLKKIPQSMLNRCDWDHDDYSLRVENLPHAELEASQVEPALTGSAGRGGTRGRRAQTKPDAPRLFDAPQTEGAEAEA